MRKNISSGTEWEPLIGYSRAVRAGNHVYVSGTTATDEQGNVVGKDDPYQQAVQTIKNIEKAFKQAGTTLKALVRTRIYVTNMDDWQEVGRAHQESFGDNPPATSLVETSGLIDEDMVVEIEAVAVIV